MHIFFKINRKINFFKIYLLIIYLISASLISCSGKQSVKEIKSVYPHAIITKETVIIPVEQDETVPSFDYTVGINDILFINVFGKPELSSTVVPGLSKLQGSRVDGEGRIQLPIIGNIKINGLTLTQIQTKIKKAYKPYINNPWVVVEITSYRSRPLYLLGQFKVPGTYYMDRPINLLQGITLGSGLDSYANLKAAKIIRKDKVMAVDIWKLLREGDMKQNIWLKRGDLIYIPDNKDSYVIVIGAVIKSGRVQMLNGRMTLLEALSATGFDETTTSYDRYIRIIRSLSPTRGELIVVDLKKILHGGMMDFQLMQDDIIYVPRSLVGSWNQVMKEILPTLQVFSGLLNPFVQIKYLSR